ncbi:MAG TPA: type II secretion system F family protein [Eubacteriales bacterium]|nr:type II secretion system F family protein [Eubacteriales bacterium]
MRLVVLACTLAVFLFFIALLNTLGRRSDQMRRRLEQVKDSERAFSDEELKKSFSERIFRPAVKRITGKLKQMAGKNNPGTQKKKDKKLDKQLKSAGINLNAQEFTFIKSILALIFLSGGAVLYLLLPFEQMYRVLILLVLVCIPVYGSSFYLKSRVKKRKEAIVRDLPDVMDLLVVSVEAGLGLDAAIVRQYTKNKSPVLAELNGAIREVQMGVPRKTALREMADRCDVKQLSAFVTALLQAEQLGVSVKSVLTAQAERLRTERKQRIQAKAMKAPVKIMLPTVAFIFPVIFIILLGPAAVSLISTFK